MATVTLRRSDLFPVGQSVGIYPAGAQRPGQATPGPPTAAVIASATVDAAGLLTVTDAAILSYTPYVAAAQVSGEWRFARVRSTLDISDLGRALGTANTSSGSAALASVTATAGAFAVGQRISGPGIPPGTYLISGSGANWTMSDKATATGTGVAVEAEGASPPQVPTNSGAGALATDLSVSRWRARVMQRRNLLGTS